MQRRKFLAASLASSAAAMLGGTEMRAEHTGEFYQLRRYFLQSGPQQKLTETYLSSALSFLENAVTHLDAKEAMRVFKQATPEERESIGDMVQTKIDKAHLPEEDRDALQAQFDRLTASRDINTSYR